MMAACSASAPLTPLHSEQFLFAIWIMSAQERGEGRERSVLDVLTDSAVIVQMFPDHQMTSKLGDRRAKGKPTLALPNGAGDWGLAGWCRHQGGVLVCRKPPSSSRIWPFHHDRSAPLRGASRWAGGSNTPVPRAAFGFKR